MNRYNVISRNDDKSELICQQINTYLKNNSWQLDRSNPQYVFVVGGDGSMLRAISSYIDNISDVVFVGIKTGTLGFLCDFLDDEIELLINNITNNNIYIKEYPLLCCECDGLSRKCYGINEIRIENIVRTQHLDIYIDNQLFEKYQGTGICLSTQLGSTAYNRSIGGAVIQEGLDLLQLTEIAGIHHAKYKSLQSPLILNNKSIVTFKSNDFTNSRLGFDTISLDLHKASYVNCYYSDKHVKIIKSDINYWQRLKELY